MDTFTKSIGIQLRRIREKKKITQEELSRRIGVPHGNISFYETGRRAMTMYMLKKICDGLQIKPSAPFRAIEDSRGRHTKNRNYT